MRNEKYNHKTSKNSKKGNYSKDSRNGKKGKGKEAEVIENNPAKYDPAHNDISWYFSNPDLLRKYATVSSGYYMGSPISTDVQWSQIGSHSSYDYVPSGITTIGFVPSLGANDYDPGHSAINLAAKRIYVKVRSANSRTANYDAADLMLYLACMDSVSMMYQHLKRAYGLSRLYAFKNMYMPTNLLMSLGISNPEGFIRDMPLIKAALDRLVIKAKQLIVPTEFNIYKRHAYICSEVYQDHEAISGQIYAFVPVGYYSYNELGSGKATWNPLSFNGTVDIDDEGSLPRLQNDGETWEEIVNIIDDLIDKLVQSQDIQVMVADLLNAYGDANVMGLGTFIPDEYMIAPVYNRRILRQIHNLKLFSRPYPVFDNVLSDFLFFDDTRCLRVTDITQIVNPGKPDNGCLTQSVYLTEPTNISMGNANLDPDSLEAYAYWRHIYGNLIDEETLDYTPEDVVYDTRLCWTARSSGSGSITIRSCGTEIPVYVRCWTLGNDRYGYAPFIQLIENDNVLEGASSYQREFNTMLSAWDHFASPITTSLYDYFPLTYVKTEHLASKHNPLLDTGTSMVISGDCTYLVPISNDILTTLNEFAWLGLWNQQS